MPQAVSEITTGAQFTRSSQEGVVADSQTRVFRIVLRQPGEVVDLQKECGVYVGDRHPYNTEIFCQSFDGRFDGESRMVLLVTFNYATRASSQGGGGQPPGASSPEIRPANWTTSVATYESPVRSWRPVDAEGAAGGKTSATNPVGDMYDGVMSLEPVVTISISQHEPLDPLRNIDAVGCINIKEVRVGGKRFAPGTVLLRSIQSQPVVEAWGGLVWRGWIANYEFLYKRNPSRISRLSAPLGTYSDFDEEIGWDVAIPVTGFNVKAIDPVANAGSDTIDVYGQPLKHDKGKIKTPLALPDNITAGDKVRAMIRVFEYENGGASQVPSAQPIPLTATGNARKESATPKVLVFRYRVYDEFDFNTLGLRLN